MTEDEYQKIMAFRERRRRWMPTFLHHSQPMMEDYAWIVYCSFMAIAWTAIVVGGGSWLWRAFA